MDATTAAAATPRVLARAATYGELTAALRARLVELNINLATLDDVSGLPDRYAQKLLADPPIKSLGLASVGPVLGALGLRLVVEEDLEQFERVRGRLVPRKYRRPQKAQPMLAEMLADSKQPATVSISRDFLRSIAHLGAAARTKKLSARRRRQIALKAAQARWRKPRLVEIT
jgi:hypothetical protein